MQVFPYCPQLSRVNSLAFILPELSRWKCYMDQCDCPHCFQPLSILTGCFSPVYEKFIISLGENILHLYP